MTVLDYGIRSDLFPDDDSQRQPLDGVMGCDWEIPSDIVALDEYFDDHDDYKRRIEEQAIRNVAYVLGDQHRKLSRKTMTMEPDRDRPKWEILLTYNAILPRLLMRLARLERVDTEWGGAPETDDDNDRLVARVNRRLSAHYYTHKFKMPEKLNRAAMMAMIMKVAFFEVNWDPLSGARKIARPEHFAPWSALTGQPDIRAGWEEFTSRFGPEAAAQGFHTQYSGDVSLDLFPIFELTTWPFNAISWDQVRVWRRKRLRTISEAARIAGVSIDMLRRSMSAKVGEDEPYQDKLQSTWGSSGDSTGGSTRTMKSGGGTQSSDMVYTSDYWVDPRLDPDRYPTGRTAFVVEKYCPPHKLGPMPFPAPRVPIFVVQDQPIEGTLFGTCMVDQMRAGQDDINDCATQMANARRRAIHPTIFTFGAFRGPRKNFDNAPGKVIPLTDPRAMPKILERPELSGDYERCIGVALRFLDDIAGTAEVDRGRTDSSQVRSGTAIARLQEKNDSRIAPLAKSMRNTSYEMGEFTMELLQEFAVDERITQIIGENNRSERLIWSRETLRPSTYGQPGDRAAMVRVTGNGAMPTSQADLIEYVEVLTKLGYMRPEAHTDLVMKSIGVGELSNYWDKARVDSASETLALEAFRNGMVPPLPRETSDFTERLDILGRWINGDEYLEIIHRFPALGDAIRERLQAIKQGMADQEAEKVYLMASADMRMRNEYLARWRTQVMKGAADPALVEAMFGMPLMARGAMAGAGPAGGSQRQPNDGGAPPEKKSLTKRGPSR